MTVWAWKAGNPGFGPSTVRWRVVSGGNRGQQSQFYCSRAGPDGTRPQPHHWDPRLGFLVPGVPRGGGRGVPPPLENQTVTMLVLRPARSALRRRRKSPVRDRRPAKGEPKGRFHDLLGDLMSQKYRKWILAKTSIFRRF